MLQVLPLPVVVRKHKDASLNLNNYGLGDRLAEVVAVHCSVLSIHARDSWATCRDASQPWACVRRAHTTLTNSWKALASSLHNDMRELLQLNLSGNGLHERSTSVILRAVLARHAALTTLDLSNNCIGVAEVAFPSTPSFHPEIHMK